jgi:hypothetical protein
MCYIKLRSDLAAESSTCHHLIQSLREALQAPQPHLRHSIKRFVEFGNTEPLSIPCHVGENAQCVLVCENSRKELALLAQVDECLCVHALIADRLHDAHCWHSALVL